MTSIVSDRSDARKKRIKYDVSFMGHDNNQERSKYLQYFRGIVKKYNLRSIISSEFVGKQKYFDAIRSSKAGLALRGIGRDTWKYWEIPSVGSLLISQLVPLNIPNNFIDEESALFFKDKEELERKIKRYVIDSEEWKEIARNGCKQFFKYHTPNDRIKNLLESVKEA